MPVAVRSSIVGQTGWGPDTLRALPVCRGHVRPGAQPERTAWADLALAPAGVLPSGEEEVAAQDAEGQTGGAALGSQRQEEGQQQQQQEGHQESTSAGDLQQQEHGVQSLVGEQPQQQQQEGQPQGPTEGKQEEPPPSVESVLERMEQLLPCVELRLRVGGWVAGAWQPRTGARACKQTLCIMHAQQEANAACTLHRTFMQPCDGNMESCPRPVSLGALGYAYCLGTAQTCQAAPATRAHGQGS